MVTDQNRDSIALTFKTKLFSATYITSQFHVEPDSSVNAGESFRTTAGEIHNTGPQTWSLWTRIFEAGSSGDNHTIEDFFVEILDLCEEHASLVAEILNNGGIATIQIRLRGTNNIGVEFNSLALHRLSILGMSLSVEVFPET
ncbi:MAG: hypothetical protein B7X35_04410 [Halothiobacillus sp. 14-56-357]|jgi:hypothetical protein|uniref:hypothetical protein n=1 Tax=Halothiobacillus sp. 15-55-196 TaxID=1970382 RepID=UPI000BC6A392|nr:hypothetical protein [Halothiobacillus sp. 15-55-196]OZB35087.1 MAG: hypothetical protein B7X44_10890 [Halothiobacillus sp. 15-55-196]OZB56687.1 MAG: hypothetical protein B7X35_04410 [Halothiobacillus sp. 14-56-357]OZB81234.1 MAG: hypothetical protein B7X28_05335 [Halothiobacillus sp. 13-55-253]